MQAFRVFSWIPTPRPQGRQKGSAHLQDALQALQRDRDDAHVGAGDQVAERTHTADMNPEPWTSGRTNEAGARLQDARQALQRDGDGEHVTAGDQVAERTHKADMNPEP